MFSNLLETLKYSTISVTDETSVISSVTLVQQSSNTYQSSVTTMRVTTSLSSGNPISTIMRIS